MFTKEMKERALDVLPSWRSVEKKAQHIECTANEWTRRVCGCVCKSAHLTFVRCLQSIPSIGFYSFFRSLACACIQHIDCTRLFWVRFEGVFSMPHNALHVFVCACALWKDNAHTYTHTEHPIQSKFIECEYFYIFFVVSDGWVRVRTYDVRLIQKILNSNIKEQQTRITNGSSLTLQPNIHVLIYFYIQFFLSFVSKFKWKIQFGFDVVPFRCSCCVVNSISSVLLNQKKKKQVSS